MKMKIDKVTHALVGYAIGLTFSFWHLWIAFALFAFFGWAKEMYDKYKANPTGFNANDMYATWLGGLLGVGAYALICEFFLDINLFTI